MIRNRWRHPGFFSLSRYVERGEDSADWGQLRSHLRDCTRCRDEVAWIKRLNDESRGLREVEPPAGIFDRILARRAAGERLILPVNIPPERPASRRAISWAGAGGVLTLVAVVLMVSLASQATAGSNNLSFAPRLPEPGEEISVRYVPTIGLAGADSLRLRVRFRASGQALHEKKYPGDYLSLTLFPDDKGVFEGRFELPSIAAYAQLAVEDTRGTTVDSNNRRLWEILAHDEKGQVRYEALRQRAYMAEWAQDWRRRKQTAAEITRLFPERPEGWSLRFLFELLYTNPTDPDSVLEVHREALSRLEVHLAGQDVGAVELAAMMDYADQIGQHDAAIFWERRLARVATGHHRLLRRRAFKLLAEKADHGKVLEAVEDAWLSSNPKDLSLAQIGLDFALRTEQWARAESWARRLTDTDPDQAFAAGRLLVAHAPPTRALGIDYLRQAASLSASNPDRMRPLGVDVLVYEREREQRLQRILTQLADALIESGEADEAVGVIVKAADLGWDPSLLKRLAQHHLTLGDTTTALDVLARAAADPLTGADAEGIGRDLAAASGLDPRAWLRSVSHEREQYRRWTLEAAEFRHLPPDVTVEAANGDRVTIFSLVPSQPTLIAVTAYLTGRFADSRLPGFIDLNDRLAERSIPFVVLTIWGDRSDFRAFVEEHRPDFPVFHDSDNLADELFGVTRTTEFLVLDADGILRGTYWELDAALRLLYLLRRPPQVA